MALPKPKNTLKPGKNAKQITIFHDFSFTLAFS